VPDASDYLGSLRGRIGRVGVWLGSIGLQSSARETAAVAQIEDLGYGAVWLAEGFATREALSHAALLLAASERITVATGIASIWARDAAAASNGGHTLSEAYDERFALGLGVSHASIVTRRGHDYARPLTAIREYLEAMERHTYEGPLAARPTPVILAALGPKMLELARERTVGAHPYFVSPAHTATARDVLGADRLLAPEQAIVLETEPTRARAAAREHMSMYLRMPNYLRHLRKLGFDDVDFDSGGSDRLVDAIVAWGDEPTIAARIREHLDAGADHVAIQALDADGSGALAQIVRLAPHLPL
jgi:probable F420-dependent oxidoreductase